MDTNDGTCAYVCEETGLGLMVGEAGSKTISTCSMKKGQQNERVRLRLIIFPTYQQQFYILDPTKHQFQIKKRFLSRFPKQTYGPLNHNISARSSTKAGASP